MDSRVRVVLSAAALGFVQVVGSLGASENQPDRTNPDAIAIALLLLGPFALAFRDRFPLLGAGICIGAVDVYVALGYAYGPIFLSLVLALFNAVQTGNRRRTWLIAAVGFVGYAVAITVGVQPHDGPPTPVHLMLVAGWLATVVAVSDVIKVRRDQEVARQTTERETAQRRVNEQRMRIAQELHDVLAHNISLINVQASVALHLLNDQPERAGPALEHIKQASVTVMNELRGAVNLLRDQHAAPYAPAPKISDIDQLIERVRSSGQHLELSIDPAASELPLDKQLAVYRIVQESITNVTRHARATCAWVTITGSTVEIVDNGSGGDAKPGNGISGMRERVESLGGSLEVGVGQAGGFRVFANLAGPTT